MSGARTSCLAPPAAALEKEGDVSGTPRASARGLRPPAPPAEELPNPLLYFYAIVFIEDTMVNYPLAEANGLVAELHRNSA